MNLNKKILHLTLKRKWFDLIVRGLKSVEYRAINDYWKKRLTERIGYGGPPIFKKYDEVWFRNGYTKDRPFMRVEIKKIGLEVIGKRFHFAIFLGKILEIKNCKPCKSADECKFNWSCVGEGRGCPINEPEKYNALPPRPKCKEI